MVQIGEDNLRVRTERLLEEHRPALQAYQALTTEEAQLLKARVDASVVAWHHVDGHVGPVPPLHFELTSTASRGHFLAESDEQATGDWLVGVDGTGRVLREGPELVYLYSDLSIDRLVICTKCSSRINSRNTPVKAANRLVLNDAGEIVSKVSLSPGGGTSSVDSYEYVDGLVSYRLSWCSRDDILNIYRVERGPTQAIERIVLEPELVVYARRKTAVRRLVRYVEAEVVRLVDLALRRTAGVHRSIYAVVLTYSGCSATSIFPPSIWLGPRGLRAAVEAGEADVESMWNPLIDAMQEVDFMTRASVLEAAVQLASDGHAEVLSKAYQRLAKRLTRTLRARGETTDDFVVLAFDPEYESIEDALKRVLPKREFKRFQQRGLVPDSSAVT